MAVVVEHVEKATVRQGKNGFLPLARCDSCGNIITRGVEGRAAWKRKEQERYREVLLLHQGCFEKLQEKRGRRLRSMPLGDFTRSLVHNLKAADGERA